MRLKLLGGVIISLNKPKKITLDKIPIINPKLTITIPSSDIILKILDFVYPRALKIAKSLKRFSKLLASPEKILKTEIAIKIIDNILKLWEPNPNIEESRVISKAGFAACN